MTNKLRTSQATQTIFAALGQSLGLQPFILSKLSIRAQPPDNIW